MGILGIVLTIAKKNNIKLKINHNSLINFTSHKYQINKISNNFLTIHLH
jgi:hypothetical protein